MEEPKMPQFCSYFFRAGIPNVGLESIKVELPPIECLSTSDMYNAPERRQLDQESVKVVQLHPLQYHFQPHVLYRYPKEDTNVAFPQHCPLFCFPNDVKFISSDTTPPAKCHSFIVTSESGSKMYGVAMVIYVKPNPDQQKQMEQWIEAWRSEHMDDSHLLMIQEIQTKMAMEKEQLLKLKSGQIHLDEEEMKEQMDLIHENIHLYEEMMSPLQPFTFTSENLYVGTAIGVLSQFPFYDFFKDWLCKLHNQMETEIQTGVISTIVERCAINLVSEIPMPPPGRLEIAVHLGASNFYVHRPPVNAISSIKNFSYYPLFRCMSVPNILTLFELLISEQKVILISSHLSMLNLVSETICSWLYPFYWHHILIPVLPARLINYLQAPVPYIIGIKRNHYNKSILNEMRPPDAAIVDIDNNSIDYDPKLVAQMPQREKKKLLVRLERYAGSLFHGISPRSSLQQPKLQQQSMLPGVPNTLQTAFIDGKYHYRTCESIQYQRKIQDIPKSYYLRYQNLFLQQKSGMVRKEPVRDRSIDAPSQNSIESSKRYSTMEHSSPRDSEQHSLSVVVSTDNLDQKLQISIEDSPVSGSTNLESASSKKTTSPVKNWWTSLVTPKQQKFPVDQVQSTNLSRNDIHASFQNINKEAKTPSFFERLIGDYDAAMELRESIGEEPCIKREGHYLYELIPFTSKETDIEQESAANPDEDLVDRFGSDTDDSDDFSRSEVSTLQDFAMRPTSRPPSRRIASLDPKRRLTGQNTPMGRVGTAKRSHLEKCKLCKQSLEKEPQRILMCSGCHMQIHLGCLDLIENCPCSVYFQEEKIRQGFLGLFVSLLKNYRPYLKPQVIQDSDSFVYNATTDVFRMDQYLLEFDSDTKPFMKQLLNSQAFSQFILDRLDSENDYDVLFFDEMIKAKLNRSKLRFSKEATPFLKDQSHQITTTISMLAPNMDNLDTNAIQTEKMRDFFNWNPSLETEPRKIQPLMTESDRSIMKSHTSELVQRARLSATKKKQEMYNWMRFKGFQYQTNEMTDEKRRELLEQKLEHVTEEIDRYEQQHVSLLSEGEIESALSILHYQTDQDQDNVQQVLSRLIRVITIYEDQKQRLQSGATLLKAQEDSSLDMGENIPEYPLQQRPPSKMRQDISKWISEASTQDLASRSSLLQSIDPSVIMMVKQLAADEPPKRPPPPPPKRHTSQKEEMTPKAQHFPRDRESPGNTVSPESQKESLPALPKSDSVVSNS